jgi:hypothetical protein
METIIDGLSIINNLALKLPREPVSGVLLLTDFSILWYNSVSMIRNKAVFVNNTPPPPRSGRIIGNCRYPAVVPEYFFILFYRLFFPGYSELCFAWFKAGLFLWSKKFTRRFTHPGECYAWKAILLKSFRTSQVLGLVL